MLIVLIIRAKLFFFRELLLLSMTVSMGMLIFAGLAYALEKDEPGTMFYTLPQTLYWAIITMTSTGKLLFRGFSTLYTKLFQAMAMSPPWPRPGSLLGLCAPSAACSASRSPSPSLSQTSTGTAHTTNCWCSYIKVFLARQILVVAFSFSQKVSFSFSF